MCRPIGQLSFLSTLHIHIAKDNSPTEYRNKYAGHAYGGALPLPQTQMQDRHVICVCRYVYRCVYVYVRLYVYLCVNECVCVGVSACASVCVCWLLVSVANEAGTGST